MSDLQEHGDELTHHDSGYDQEKSVQRKLSEIFGENPNFGETTVGGSRNVGLKYEP